ncbi:PXA domain-containing protein [Xylariomycetidae sp. FL2044]|nr:PXA domain-containing protein [Xylariomycetidae sp. FL2044]
MSAPPTSPVPPFTGQNTANLKAPATSGTTSAPVIFAAASKHVNPSRATPPLSAHRRATRPLSSDFLSDKATAALIRRTLCAQHLADRGRSTPAPIEDLLPPLTSRNDVDLQLYALISIIIREFVQNWYNRITPDETFVAEVVQIIAHCTRALEQRLRKVDLESLVFDELPELLDTHVRVYRTAKSSAVRPPVETNPREIYHALCPMPALSPVPQPGDSKSFQLQADNEAAYRQLLVQGVLTVLLPTEDLENACLTSLVGQLFSELIIGNLVANKVSEPWMIWEILIMVTRLLRKKGPSQDSRPQSNTSSMGRDEPNHESQADKGTHLGPVGVFWSAIHWGFITFNLIRFVINTVILSWSLPQRTTPILVRPVDPVLTSAKEDSSGLPAAASVSCAPAQVPVVDFKLWSCIKTLLELDVRMPWVSGAFSLLQWGAKRGPGKVAGFDGIVDRLLSHDIQVHILDAAHLPPLLRSVRAAVFPNNAPGSPSLFPPSSDQQLSALRRRCASALLALFPKRVGRLYYGSSSVWTWLSGTAGKTGTRSNADGNKSRSGPLISKRSETNSSARNNQDAVPGTGGEVACVRLTDGGKPDNAGSDDVTLPTNCPKRQLGYEGTGERPLEGEAGGSTGKQQQIYQASIANSGHSHISNLVSNKEREEIHYDDDDDHEGDRGEEEKEGEGEEEEEPDEDEERERILSEIETGILDVFSDAYCNKHLVYGILELVLVRLIPELAEKGVVDLWDERLS